MERWPYNGNRRPWPYKVSSTRFFKTPMYPNGLISDTKPWPYNRGNTEGNNKLLVLTRDITTFLVKKWSNNYNDILVEVKCYHVIDTSHKVHSKFKLRDIMCYRMIDTSHKLHTRFKLIWWYHVITRDRHQMQRVIIELKNCPFQKTHA